MTIQRILLCAVALVFLGAVSVFAQANSLPVLDPIGAQSTTENVNLSFGVTSSDLESTPVVTTSTLPSGATFTPNGSGGGTFDWTPTFLQSGSFDVTFYATDDSAAVDSEVVTITVNEAGNQPPVLTGVGPQSTTENVNLNFVVSSSDIESTPVVTTSTLPTGATFTPNGSGGGTFDWTPTFLQSGSYDVTFYATDDSAAVDSEVVTITVNEAGNQLPILTSIGAQSTTENVNLNFVVSSSDIESTPVVTTSSLPTGATFTPNGSGGGTFDWTPDFLQSGSYDVTIYATDDSAAVDSEVVTITVNEAGNQLPILAAIGAQSTTENANLNFVVSSSDIESTPVVTTSTLPTGATFTPNGSGGGTFDWTPTFLQAGSYDVTFYATDDSAAVDSEVVTITVSEAGNQLPVLTAIGAQSTTENVNLNFAVSSSDVESTPVVSTSTLPTGATFTPNGSGGGTFDWTPDFLQSGSYDVTFYATDDSAAVDSEVVTITVNEAGNQLPTLSAIGPQSTTENVNLNFVISSSDIESTPVISTSTLPSGATFTPNGSGGGTFDWTPDFLQSGSYDVTFYATDDSAAVDSEVVTITVSEAGNQLPILVSIGAQSTTENVNVSFGVTSSDLESTPVVTTSSLPTGATFTPNGSGGGTFAWTPTFLQAGSYDVTFYATDDSAAVDSEVVTITVNEAGNQLPILTAIGAQSTTENVNLNLAVSSSDVESTPVVSTSTLPTGATFTPNGTGGGTFDWTPDFLQSGSYDVTFYATDDSAAVDSEVVTITVNEAGNQLPVLSAIGAQSTTENVNLNFVISSSDIESTPVVTTSALPTGATFTPNGSGGGTFDWTPTFLQAGSYDVTFYATDDSAAVDSEVVSITVNEAGNQLPILAAIGAQSTTENVNLNFAVSSSDIESTPVVTTSTLPTGATFTPNGSGGGTFDWTPTFLQSGSYDVTIYATDDSAAVDSEVVTITVNEAGNQLPILTAIGAQSTTENVNLNFVVSSSDIESTPVVTTSSLPTGATFTPNGLGGGTFDWTPDFLQSGSYDVTFYATDDSAAVDSEVVTITVSEAGNQLPVLTAIGAQSTTENVNLNFAVSSSDIESTPVVTTSTLPTGATFTPNGSGGGTFDWTPTFLQAGSYDVTFYATDDSAAVDSEVVSITVNEAGNQPPVLTGVGPQSTTENVNLNFVVSSSDVESTPVVTTSTLPTGATFTPNGSGGGTFDWTPTFLQAGSYDVTFYATDDSAAVDSEVVTITVNEAGNQLPVLTAIGAQSTTENVNLNFVVSSSDIESTPVVTTSSLPTGATFTPNGSGGGTFDWTPTFLQAGSYDVTFYATDDSAAIDSEVVTITVNEAGNQLPILDPIGAKSVNENVNLNFVISSSDIESTPTASAENLPAGATFTPNGSGGGTFDWTPSYVQSGVYNVTFITTDADLGADSEIVVITVNEVGNQLPVLGNIGPKSITEGLNLNFAVSSTDAESTPTVTTTALPSGATFTPNGSGGGTFDWTPNFFQRGSYLVMFYATDDSAAVDSEIVTINVIEAGNQLPVLDPIGSQNVSEGNTLNFVVTSSDIESTPVASAANLPTGATFTPNGSGGGTFNWTTDFTDAGLYDVTFYSTDDSAAVDSEVVTITVTEAGNQPPVLASIGPRSTVENVNLNFTISSTDAESTPTASAENLPTGATFTPDGSGGGTFDWTPDFLQSGVYNVTFITTDADLASDTEIVAITVNDGGNQQPILSAIGPQSTTENVNLNFVVTSTDIESTPVVTTSVLPTGASFTPNGAGGGTFDWTPDFLQSGSYDVTFYATDDSAAVDSEVVMITVNDGGNQLPILAPIGSKSTPEGANLNFVVSSSDIESTPTVTTSTLPTGATFTPNGSGGGTFNWTPSYLQSGVYPIIFVATDDSAAADTEIVTITVTETGNQTPILATIGPRNITEGANLNFTVTSTDAESTPVVTTSTLPSGASFTPNGSGGGTFDWTPTFVQAGSYDVTFYATDDSAAVDSEVVTITVLDAGNQPPVMASIGSRSTTEDVNLNFTISSTDAESTPTASAENLPTGSTFTPDGSGGGTFDWTPTFLQSGIYNVTFITTDASLASDTEIVAITVNDGGNQLPILSAIGAQSTTEGANLNFAVSSTDIESTPVVSTSTLPTGAVFTPNGSGGGTFDWTPDFLQSGSYDITFYATDDSTAVDSEVVTIAVNDGGNQLPILSGIGPQSVSEGVNLNFVVSSSDVESTPVVTTSALPTGASFTPNGSGGGTFDWTPTFVQAGSYDVTFYATDDSAAVDSEVVTITVLDAGNQPPVLDPIGPQVTTENVNLNFAISSSDAESTPTASAVNLPTGATFTPNGTGGGTFDWTPDFLQSGVYNVTFITTDASLASDTEIVAITVNDGGNQLPILAAIGPQSTTENVNLNFVVSSSDIESTPVITTSALPTGASFAPNGSGGGTFDWTPDFLQSGSYDVIFYATDDSAAVDSEVVTVTVNDGGNQLPILDPIGAQSTTENVNLNFVVTSSDIESTPIVTTSALPTGASFTPNGSGGGTFDWTPTFVQAGSYDVTFYATDDSAAVDSEVVTITVLDAGNQPPVLDPIGPQVTTENVNLNFAITSSDAESTPTASAENLPTGATFTPNGSGGGTFDWTPTFLQSGIYNVTFVTTDASLASDTEIVAITVNDGGNQLPILAAIGPQSTTENANLNFVVISTDIESTPVITTSALPTGAIFTPNGSGGGTFDWTPTYVQAGSYDVTFYATDDSAAVDSEVVTITVNEAGNQPPVLDPIGAQSVNENQNLNFAITASDAESTPTASAVNLPSGASFTPNGSGGGTFDWTPTIVQAGVYNVTFITTDADLASDTEIVAITVNEVGNQAPVLAAIGPRSTAENVNLNFSVSSTDAESIPVVTTSTLPGTATFTPNGSGGGTFDWTPSFADSGVYQVTFYATDDSAAVDSEIVTITVTNDNLVPIADAGPDQVDVPAGALVTLDGSGSSDPDADSIGYSWIQISGTAVILSSSTEVMPTFTPTIPDIYTFELTVDDAALSSAPDTVSIFVVNGAPPVAINDLTAQISSDAIQLNWSAVTLDTSGFASTINHYVIYRGTSAYFNPTSIDSIAGTDDLTTDLLDNNLGGANVVGDTTTNYFYVVQAVDIYGNRSDFSNRVGEYDYQLVVTPTTNFNLVGIPFTNTGITTAVQLIAAIGSSNVLTVNNFVATSQSYQSRFAAGFGTNFAVTVGGVYQVNAATNSIFSVAGSVPDSGSVNYPVITTATTDYGFIMIPFELQSSFSVAQDVLNSAPGLFNTLNNFRSGPQNYESRFSVGFGVNFPVKAGKPYQTNAASTGTFPVP